MAVACRPNFDGQDASDVDAAAHGHAGDQFDARRDVGDDVKFGVTTWRQRCVADRGFGKSVSKVETGGVNAFSGMTDEEVDAMVAELAPQALNGSGHRG